MSARTIRLGRMRREARDRQTVLACIEDVVREGRELTGAEVLREWQDWGCPYKRSYALAVVEGVLRGYLRDLARGAEVCA